MYTSSIRALRADLATAVRRAEAGEPTAVTVRGRHVATIAPIIAATTPSGTTVEQLVASGALVAARRRDEWRPDGAVPIWTGTRIDRALREVRG